MILLSITSSLLVCLFLYWQLNSARRAHAPPFEAADDRYAALQEEAQLLRESIEHYPMPYALYDKHDRLVAWNQPYERVHEQTFASLRKKSDATQLFYRDIVLHEARQKLSGEPLNDYIERRVANQRKIDGHVSDREYPTLGWYRVSKYLTPSGGVAGIAIDINELKEREAQLLEEIERRKRLEVNIRHMANTDELTGLANRRLVMEKLASEFDISEQNNTPMSVAMLDIDHFKSVNDTYGHATGDEVIATVAAAAASQLQCKQELIGRIGGEEFAILSPGTDADHATGIAERVREAIASLSFVADGCAFSITISAGIAERSDVDSDSSALLGKADVALYEAKAQGRNRVNRFEPCLPVHAQPAR